MTPVVCIHQHLFTQPFVCLFCFNSRDNAQHEYVTKVPNNPNNIKGYKPVLLRSE